MRKVGDKEAVYYGEAEHTPGGLYKEDLMTNSKGKIVSIRQHQSGMEKVKNLKDARGGSFRGFLERGHVVPRGGEGGSLFTTLMSKGHFRN